MKVIPPPITTLSCVPASIGAPYAEAFNTCAILPGHALVQVRGALASLVEAWLRHHLRGITGTLYEQIERLLPLLGLTASSAQRFHVVRVAGNLGAHPEHGSGAAPTRGEARNALFELHGLVCDFAGHVGGIEPLAIPAFAEPPEVHWGDVCERAIFERDAAAMLAVGRRHRAEAIAANEESERNAKADQSSMWFVERGGFQDALNWFQRAMLNTLDSDVRREAWFEQARLLLTELLEHERAGEAMDLLRWSAEDGVADAQSMLALLILDPRSPLPEPRDLVEARGWAERAATAEHPEALNVLTAIYGNGQGVEPDRTRAIAYARRASQAGYPLAHANLALLLLDLPAEVRDDEDIRGAIDRAKQAGVGHGYWAEYRFLNDKGLGRSSEANEALRVAADGQVPAAMLACAQRAMHDEAHAWDLGRIAGWLIGVLGSTDAGEERVEAREMLVRVRDEGCRRMRCPDPRATRKSVDDLFGAVLQAGACLDLGPGENSWDKTSAVMSALARIMMPRSEEPATHADVELLVGAMPDFQVRWTGTKAEAFGGAAAAARAMRGETATPQLGNPETRVANRVPTRGPSRNGLCPCGSGRKFKGCCGRGR